MHSMKLVFEIGFALLSPLGNIPQSASITPEEGQGKALDG